MANSIGKDWRNLARQLAVAEKDIFNIQVSTCDPQKAAIEVILK